MPDWMDGLNRKERESWNRFVRNVRRDAVGKIAGSAWMMTLVPDGETDVKFAVELGLGIMMDKPIVAVAIRGRPIPPGLRRVAHAVIELEADFDTEEGREEMATKLRRTAFLLGLDLD